LASLRSIYNGCRDWSVAAVMIDPVPSAGFVVQADGGWLPVESPDGRRAAINLAEIVGDTSQVAAIFREWSDDLVCPRLKKWWVARTTTERLPTLHAATPVRWRLPATRAAKHMRTRERL